MAEYCLDKGFIDPAAVERINNGEGSYQMVMLVRHAYRDFALNMADLMPLFTKLPKSFGDRYLKTLCLRKHSSLAQTLGFIGIPLMNPWQAAERLEDLTYMTWHLFNRFVGEAIGWH